jgi:hypothetical protein
MLNQFLTDNTTDTTEVKPSVLKVRGKTLIFGNVVYQIHNISSLGLVDLSTTKPIPRFFWALVLIGLVFLFVPNIQAKILGVLILAFVAWLFYQHHQNRTTERYGMTIYTNAGTKTIFVNKSEEYIKKVILTLYTVMNSDELKAINFNFETLSIDQSNRAIQIGTNIGSSVVSGHVGGDVASEV